MNNNNTWIPWKDRKDLDNRYALIGLYPCEDGYCKRDVSIGSFVFLLPTRTIPDNRIEQVQAGVLPILNLSLNKCSVYTPSGESVDVDIRYTIEFPKFTELSQKDRAIVNLLESNGDNCSLPEYTTAINHALNKIEAIDRYEFELSSTGAAQTPGADNSTDSERMKKELSNIFGRGSIGKKRLIMRDKYGLNDEKIYEYENPGYSWNDLDAEEKHRQNVTIFLTIKKAREKSSQL